MFWLWQIAVLCCRTLCRPEIPVLHLARSAPDDDAWLRIGELQANKIELQAFDKKKLTDALPFIQNIAFNEKPNWKEELQTVCASFGVALVYSPCLSKAPIFGAARWIKNKSVPLIQLTDRRKDYNAFWFTCKSCFTDVYFMIF
jgi:hypothetical protein